MESFTHLSGFGKLDLLLRANKPLMPGEENLQKVRMAEKKRINVYPFMPYTIYIRSLPRRRYRRIFENSFSERRTLLDEESRLSLTSKTRY